MVDKIVRASDSLLKTITASLPSGTAVTEARPSWHWKDLLGDRVNVYLFHVEEDRLAANELLPSTSARTPVTLSYLVTFYGRGAGANIEAVLERLAKDVVASGPHTTVRKMSMEEMAALWNMFRRRYALSIVVEVRGTLLG